MILPLSSPDSASAETEKPSVDREGDPGGGGVKAGEGERCRGRPKESTRTPGGEQTLNFMSIVIIIVIVK